jgi:hypothetical protein
MQKIFAVLFASTVPLNKVNRSGTERTVKNEGNKVNQERLRFFRINNDVAMNFSLIDEAFAWYSREYCWQQQHFKENSNTKPSDPSHSRGSVSDQASQLELNLYCHGYS